MQVERPEFLPGEFSTAIARSPGIRNFISRVVPAQESFDFDSVEDFEAKARKVALRWVPQLRGRTFHVRLHRRGFKGTLSSQKEEQFLDAALLTALQSEATISFVDPDAIVQIETVGGRAGMSFWTREDLQRYRFLGVD